jgi:hypothetical protein
MGWQAKEEPTPFDLEIYSLCVAQGLKHDVVAEMKGITRQAVEYHISEAKRLSNIDLEDFARLCKSCLMPITADMIKGAKEEIARQRENGKVDLHAVIKWLNGVAVMSQNVNAKMTVLPESSVDPDKLKRDLAQEILAEDVTPGPESKDI